MEYRIRTKEAIRIGLTGFLIYFLGALCLQRTLTGTAGSMEGLTAVIALFCFPYGAYVLSKPFMSTLAAYDRGLIIREGFKPKLRLQYADISSAVYDALSTRVVFLLENGRRFSFEYIYVDINEFLSRLTQNGIDVRSARSNPA